MTTKNNVVTGLFWVFLERIGAQGIGFIISIVLARLLLPEEYGTIAIVTIFISIADTFVTAGFGNALIQKKDADDLDFSTVYYFNICFSLIIYFLLFAFAPYVSMFFQKIELTLIIRVMGIRIIFSGINSVQRAFVSREFLFKKFFYSTLTGTLCSAIVGIYLAIQGFGVWALVFQYMTNTIIDTIILRISIKWRPKRAFSFYRLKSLFSFGWKLLLSSLLSVIYMDIYSIIIGKVYSSGDLAYYDRGKKFPQIFSANVTTAIDTVLFPAMAIIQEDTFQLKRYVRKSITIGSFIVFPLMFGMAAVAENMIPVILTEKWNESIIFVQIACISFALLPIGMANIQAIKALGRSDIYLKLDIIKKIIGLSLLITFYKKGVIMIAIVEGVSNFLGLFINTYYNKRFINYSIAEQLKDIIPNCMISFFMAIVVLYIGKVSFISNSFILLVIQIIIGIILYVLLSYIFKIEAAKDVMELVKFKRKEV